MALAAKAIFKKQRTSQSLMSVCKRGVTATAMIIFLFILIFLFTVIALSRSIGGEIFA